jgi:hypothetical protein
MIPIADDHLLACPKCGGMAFVRVQTGYTQLVPCEIFADGSVAVCHYEDEELDEEDDGARWERRFVCANSKCSYVLADEDLGEDGEVNEVDCVSPTEITKALIGEHGVSRRDASRTVSRRKDT